MPISPDFTSILQRDWKITFLQCYPNGYLKHTDLCNILQLTAALHSELGGISFRDMQVYQQAWVLSRMRVEIYRLPRWKEKITVKTWINSLENSRSIRCMEVYVGDEKIVGCETFWAVFNTEKRRPENLALPHRHFEKFPERATSKPFGKIDLKPEMEFVTEHTVKLSDLDIVNHVNNVKYLEWCLDLVDFDIIMEQKIESFDMNFMKELSLCDKVQIKSKATAQDIVFGIQREESACFALQLFLK